MSPALILGQHIDLGVCLHVRLYRAGLGQDLPALNIFSINPSEQAAHGVAGYCFIKQLVEHFHAGDNGLSRLGEAHHLYFVLNLDDPPLNTPGHHGATTLDVEYVFNRHQEGLILGPIRLWDVLVHSLHQVQDALHCFRIVLQRLQRGHPDDGDVVPWEVVLRQELADLHLHQLQQLRVIHCVTLVQRNNNRRHIHLASQKDVLSSLGHWAVWCAHYQDCAVHLGCAGDHVLDIVGVTRAVYVSIVTVLRFILHVRDVDGHTTGLLFRGLVNLIKGHILCLIVGLLAQHIADGSSQRRLTVVNVTNGADVKMRFVSNKLLLSHLLNYPPQRIWSPQPELNRRPRSYQERALPLSYVGPRSFP